MAELSVVLSARVRKFVQELDKAEKALLQTGEVAETTQRKVSSIGTRRASAGIKQIGKASVNATPALQEFSRVIQDAPFGIQGIANNIQQLTANFGNLQKSAGGAIPALKAMLGALAGPGGILLAVSAITSLLVVFGDKLFSASKQADKLQKSLERLNKSFDIDLKLNEAIEESLVLQGKSTDGILLARKDILRAQLQSLDALFRQQAALLKTKQIENERVSIYEALLGVAAGAAVILETTFDKLKNAAVSLAASQAVILGLTDKLSVFASATAKDKKEESDLTLKLKEIELQRLKIANDLLELEQRITEEKAKQAIVANIPKNLGEQFAFNPKVFGDAVVKAIDKAVKTVRPKLSRIEQAIQDFNLAANELIQNQTAAVFSNLGDVIGRSIAEGGNVFSAIGAGLLGSFGQFLSRMGDLLIKYGALAIAKGKIDTAIAAGGPIAIGAGIAAIAVGTLLKAAGGALSGTARGGFSGGGFSGSGGGPTGSITTGRGFVGGDSEVVFRISGTDLIGVLQRAGARNTRLGGNFNIGG